MTLVPHELPEYVELGGRQVFRPPYTAREAEIFGFVLEADRTAIDALLREALTEPTKGAVDYRCAHDNIVITFADIGALASGDPPDSLLGYLPEREVSVWCLAADVAAAGRLVWYLPYVFTDSGQTVATGREVYGYPKQIGQFADDYPERLVSGGVTTMQALAIDPYGPDVAATPRPMISVNRQALRAGHEGLAVGASSLEEFTFGFPHEQIYVHTETPFGRAAEPSAAIRPIGAPPPARAAASPPWVRGLFDTLRGRSLGGDPFSLIIDMINNPTLVFLKQFRDVLCPTKACYQAVVEAPLGVHLTSAHYEALEPALFEVAIANWASHPIASDLGVPAGTPLTPKRVFHALLDFDILLGEEVWRSPT